MDKLTHKNALYIMYGVLTACLLIGLSYNYGYSKGYANKSKPMYIKYTSNFTQSLAVTLRDVGIFAEPSQIEELGKRMKENSKRVR